MRELSSAELTGKTVEAVQFTLAEMARASDPLRARRMELVRLIISGELTAVGFLKGDLESYREIPPGLLDPVHFNWAKSWVSNGEIRFEKVKVARSRPPHSAVGQQPADSPVLRATDTHAIGLPIPSKPGAEPEPRKRGPKPLDRFIEKAIKSLWHEPGFLGASQTEQIHAIIAQARTQNPARFKVDGSKPSFSTVWRYLDAHPLPEPE